MRRDEKQCKNRKGGFLKARRMALGETASDDWCETGWSVVCYLEICFCQLQLDYKIWKLGVLYPLAPCHVESIVKLRKYS